MSGLTARIVAAWRDPALSFEAERGAGEARIAAFALGASLFATLGRILSGNGATNPALGAADLTGHIAVNIFVGLSFLPLALYLVAALITLLCRPFGGTGGWQEGRIAFFWSGLAAGPAGMIAHGVAGLLGVPALGETGAGALWLFLFLPMLAVSHGFSERAAQALRVVMLAVAVLLLTLALR